MASIYQRSRPRRFDEVVGQEHVKDVLLAALRRGQVGHAYLFSGPRGVGKTTTARLLAMAVNCDAADELRPCGACESCLMVQRGEHPDVVELDAASNNSVDDVRDLREKVRLASLRGGRRVWVLDEAHMLSRAAANALLKTLEEPPPGLVFVLATTEPEKLPATVLSRCQHFRFRRLSEDQIRSKLVRLAAETRVEADDDALALVARAADGAMRDAESLLERLLVEGQRVTRERAEAALGLPPQDRLEALARALTTGAWDALLGEAGDLYRDGFAPRTVAEQLGRTLRDGLFATVTGGEGPRFELDAAGLARAIDALDQASERFVRQNDLYALEVALLRAASAAAPAVGAGATAAAQAASPAPPSARATPSRPAPPSQPAPPARPAPSQPTPPQPAPPARPAPPAFDPHARPPAGTPMQAPEPSRPPEETGAAAEPPAAGAPAPASDPARPTPPPFSWYPTMAQAATQLKAFLLPAEHHLEGTTLTLRFDERHAFHFSQLRKREAELLALIDAAGGASLELIVEGPGGRDRHGPRAPLRDGGSAPAKKS
jgi:DNA polymerase III subunit gamma/tau